MARRRWEVLEELIKAHRWSRGIELGVLKGETYLYLLEHCPGLTLTGVDTFRFMPGQVHLDGGKVYEKHDWKRYEARVRGHLGQYQPRAKLLKMTTLAASTWVDDGTQDFVFIDADHNTRAVAEDIVVWSKKLKPQGWLLGHDTHFPTVRKAIDIMLPGWKEHPDHVWAIPLQETFLSSGSSAGSGSTPKDGGTSGSSTPATM